MSTGLMNPPKPAPASAPAWKPYRWTIAEYRDLDKTGLFHDLKTMLIDGEIFFMPLPSPLHNGVVILTEAFLREAFRGQQVYIRNQIAFDIGTRNDPGPDLAVVPGSMRDSLRSNPTEAILIVEVAVTSLRMDTTTKAELYASAGVPEYWVIDVPGRELHVYRNPVANPEGLGADAYRSHLTFGPNDIASPLAVPGSAVKVSELLP